MILSIYLYHWDFTPHEAPYFSDVFEVGEDEIIFDQTSDFTIEKDIFISKGDWLVAKLLPLRKTIYIGVVDSQEGKTIRCRGLLGLADSEIPTNRISGNSFENHAKNLITSNLINDPTKNLSGFLDVQLESNTPHSYQASEVNSRKLNSYLINGFKKYNIKWYIKEIRDKRLYTALKQVERTIKIADNSSEFYDWDVFVKKPGTGTENKLIIVDKAMSNMESPNILATYYLTQDGVTTDPNHPEIIRPTVTKVYLYDRTMQDAPSFDEVANSELKGNAYSHEITVKVRLDSKNLPFETIETGLLAEVKVKGVIYKSVLTAWRINSQEKCVMLTFGNIRSRFRDHFED